MVMWFPTAVAIAIPALNFYVLVTFRGISSSHLFEDAVFLEMDGHWPVQVPLLRDAMPMQPALIHEHRQWTAPCEQLLDAVAVVPPSPETDNDADELVQVFRAPVTVRTRRKRWYRSWVGLDPLTTYNSKPFMDISVCVV